MSIYLANYWSLYRKFIEVFKNLKYRDIPLSLLTNFYQQIDEELKIQMENENFRTTVLLPEMKQEEIQPYFEGWLEKIRAPLINQSKGGMTLVNNDYTRIPEITYRKWFDPRQTIILSRSKGSHMYGMPNKCILHYEETNNEIAESLVKSSKFIFSKLKDHPAFSNDYFQKTFLTRIPLMVKTINSVYNLLEKHNISTIVVGTTEDMVSRTLAIIGSMKGIKSICLQHGILMGEEAFMPVFTSMVGVYGEYEKNWYLQRGLTHERIAEIGHPKYDQIFEKLPEDTRIFLKKFNLDSHKRTLLVITGPNLDMTKFKELIKNLADNPNYQLIIKPHPWEIGKGKIGMYLDLEKKYKSLKVFTSRENNLYELISQVDGVVSSLSTVVLESIFFNKPVFVFDFVISNRSYDYYKKLGEFIQTEPDLLGKVINNYYSSSLQKEIYNNIRNQYVSESYNDGSSGKKLIHLIKQFHM